MFLKTDKYKILKIVLSDLIKFKKNNIEFILIIISVLKSINKYFNR